MTVRTAVITAAGYGTRFLPITKAVPKEMLPLVDRPVIHYAVEQAVEAGIERIILVTSEGKETTEEYFRPSLTLERTLEERGSAKLDEVRRVSNMVEIVPVVQEQQRGLGHAVLCAKEMVGNEPFIVYLPDEILLGTPSVTKQVLGAFERLGECIVGVKEVPREDVERYGVAAGERLNDHEMRLSHCVEKPSIVDAPSNLAIFGPYVFTPAIFECLESITTGAFGELQLTDGIDLLASREPVFAYSFEGERYDAGTPLGLLETSVELALKRSEYADDVKRWIRALAERLDS